MFPLEICFQRHHTCPCVLHATEQMRENVSWQSQTCGLFCLLGEQCVTEVKKMAFQHPQAIKQPSYEHIWGCFVVDFLNEIHRVCALLRFRLCNKYLINSFITFSKSWTIRQTTIKSCSVR